MATEIDCDVVIVGAGPAGLAAALTLRERGVERVVVLEREAEAGGVPRHCGHPPFGMREFGRILSGPAYARRLAGAAQAAGIDIRLNSTVTGLRPGGQLDITTPAGLGVLTAQRVILATGARETSRAARLLPGERPVGVITTGALQHSIYIERLLPFRRPVIVGTELVSISAMLTCLKAGIRPVAYTEPNARPTLRRPLDLFPRLFGVPLYLRSTIVDITGRGRVERVSIVDRMGVRRDLDCDGLLLTGQFVPKAALVRSGPLLVDPSSGGPVVDQSMCCSDPSYLLRPIETAGWSFREGRRVGTLVADDLNAGTVAHQGEVHVSCRTGLKLVMPQRLRLDMRASGLPDLQIRAQVSARGVLAVTSGGKVIKVIWQQRCPILPERRLLIPLSDLLPHLVPGTELDVSFRNTV